MNTACTGAGSYCCCSTGCSTVNNQNGSMTTTCTCTKFCNKCGNCQTTSCQVCSADNNQLESQVQVASLEPFAAQGGGGGHFEYTAAAAESLAEKSTFAAQVLRNLTTRCAPSALGSKDDQSIVLSDVRNAPFGGGHNVTVDGVPSIFEYTGTITVGVRKAILDIEYPASDGTATRRIHAEVSESGDVVFRER